MAEFEPALGTPVYSEKKPVGAIVEGGTEENIVNSIVVKNDLSIWTLKGGEKLYEHLSCDSFHDGHCDDCIIRASCTVGFFSKKP